MRRWSLAVSGGLLVVLGTLHVMFQLGLDPADAPPVMAQMEATVIEMMGTHTLLQFHVGFSLMMGTLLIAYGLLVATAAYEHRPGPLLCVVHLATCAVATWLSVLYFHPLAWGFCLAALLVGLVALVPRPVRSLAPAD